MSRIPERGAQRDGDSLLIIFVFCTLLLFYYIRTPMDAGYILLAQNYFNIFLNHGLIKIIRFLNF